MFEVRLGRAPGWRVVAPSPPDDVTPEQVRQAVGSSPHTVAAVELSAVFLNRRPGGNIQEWRTLDQELEAAGIAVYFAPGGCASWEIKVSTGEAQTQCQIAGNGPVSPDKAVTGVEVKSGKGGEVLHPESAGPSGVEDRIAQLAGLGLGSRRIAAALEAEGYLRLSHMTVARILRREARLPPEPET